MRIDWQCIADGIVSPEGPAADRHGNVFLVNRWRGRLLKVDSAGRVLELLDTGGKPQSVALLPSGDLLFADAKNRALYRLTQTGELRVVADRLGDERFLGPNDLVVADDVVYLTDPGLEMDKPTGRILRIEFGTGRVTVVSQGHHFPNGITLTADSRYLFVAESATHRILRFALLDSGHALSEPEVFFEFEDHLPDGIALDCEGNLLVTLCGAGRLEVLSPGGTLKTSISTPGKNCTNCVFGGSDFLTLYLTEDEQQALLSTRWPVPGQRRYSRSL